MDIVQEKMQFDFPEMNDGAGSTLMDLLKIPLSQFNEKMERSKESSPDMDASDSSADSEEPEEIVDDLKDDEERDEDFIVVGTPKPKKKVEKRTTKSSNKSSRKRKCEFCGAVETPMWRRGPAGKGTLCNACGVKWSLKFRKRNPKKPKLDKKDDTTTKPKEQRQSARKKVPTSKAIAEESKEDHSPETFCCAHSHAQSPRKRHSMDDNEHSPPVMKKKKKNHSGSEDEDSLSDEDSSDLRLLGRLLNVVEYQLVEEKQIDLVKKQLAFHELTGIRGAIDCTSLNALGNTQQNLLESTAQTLAEFTKNIRNQMDEIRMGLGNTEDKALGKKFDNLQVELSILHAQMDANFAALKATAANDAIMLEKMLLKESALREELTFPKPE